MPGAVRRRGFAATRFAFKLAAMSRLLIFGLGYTASRLAARLRGEGWHVTGTSRATLPLDDSRVVDEIAAATHILSSVPPVAGSDPVLDLHHDALAETPAWLGYLSSTGVYGDTGGAWVDESATIGTGRRNARAEADLRWQALGARVFRLPGIYGPSRSALDRVRAGQANRVDGTQVFGRIHVDDIVAAVIAGFDHGPAVWNVADGDPASGNAVTEYACDLLGLPYPQFVPVAALSAMAQGFYTERRRVAATKITRDLRLRLRYPDYRAGLRACMAEENT